MSLPDLPLEGEPRAPGLAASDKDDPPAGESAASTAIPLPAPDEVATEVIVVVEDVVDVVTGGEDKMKQRSRTWRMRK